MLKSREIHAITPEALIMLGVEQIAYVKKLKVNDHSVYTVHAADGKELGGFSDRDVALAACIQHDLEPVSVH